MSEVAVAAGENLPNVTYEKQTALNVWKDKEAFDQVARVAGMLAKSSIVPQNYQGKPEDCFIAVEMAARMNTSPIFIMQNLYVVKGKPSWAGQACMAMIMSCGKFRNVRHVYTGEKGKDNRGCYVEAVRVSNGELVTGTEVTMGMVKAEGWINNSKWKSMPEQMLGYRAASFFARMYCPEAMMGLQTREEIYDADPELLKRETREPIYCECCGEEIRGLKSFTAEQIASASRQKYGQTLCVECGKKAKAEAEAAEAEARIAEQEAREEARMTAESGKKEAVRETGKVSETAKTEPEKTGGTRTDSLAAQLLADVMK